MSSSWTVCFEYVSAERFPQHYCRCSRVHPTSKPQSVAKEHWTPVQVEHTNYPDAVDQFRNLRMLSYEGHLIRNITLTSDEDLLQDVRTG